MSAPDQHMSDRMMKQPPLTAAMVVWLCIAMVLPMDLWALPRDVRPLDKDSLSAPPTTVHADAIQTREPIETNLPDTPQDSPTVVTDPASPYGLDGKKIFNPDPTRAVWLSALCPGLGQVYNRRYWKLPIVVGGFMGLAYATNWNNNQLQDYSRAFRDITDTDPSTKSYMDFFPPTTLEEDLDTAWLTSVMRSRKNFYRRNRDLCIICMVALYLICMVDAYVDASMAHFDISPDLSLDLSPSMLINPADRRVALGLNWAFTF